MFKFLEDMGCSHYHIGLARFSITLLAPYIIISGCKCALLLRKIGVQGISFAAISAILFILSISGLIFRIIAISRISKFYYKCKIEEVLLRDIEDQNVHHRLYVSHILKMAYISNVAKCSGVLIIFSIGLSDALKNLGLVGKSLSDVMILGTNLRLLIALFQVFVLQFAWTAIDLYMMFSCRHKNLYLIHNKNGEENREGESCILEENPPANNAVFTKHNIGVSAIITCFILNIISTIISVLLSINVVKIDLPIESVISITSRVIGFIGIMVCLACHCVQHDKQYQLLGATIATVLPMTQIENFDSLTLV